LTRWKSKGLAERAALDSIEEAGLPILGHGFADLSDYAKLSFSGSVPLSGKVGMQADKVIAALVAKGAIPPKGTRKAKEKAGVAT
jgi:chromosome partitioning protein